MLGFLTFNMNFGFTLIAVVFFNCFCDDGLVTGTALPYAPVTQKPVPPTYVDPVVAKNLGQSNSRDNFTH